MNYLETGLAHTEFFPKKTFFSPPRCIPMSGLSRKYMGLEPVTKKEINITINRLSKPKKRPVDQEDPEKVLRETRPMVTGTGRFVGRKRMSNFQIEKMVARLYNRRVTKDFSFVDEAADPNVITNRLDDESGSEMDEPEMLKEKPILEREHSVLRKDSSFGLNKETHKTNMNVHFQDMDTTSDIPTFNIDSTGRRSDSKSKELNTMSKSSSVHKTRDKRRGSEVKSAKQQDTFKVPKFDYGRSVSMDAIHNKKIQSLTNDGFKPAKFETIRPSTSDINLQRSPKMTRESQRPSTTESSQRSSRQAGVKADDGTNQKSRRTPMPCDELLIDRVATYNRSPRQRHEVKR